MEQSLTQFNQIEEFTSEPHRFGGQHVIVRFKNQYGASMIRNIGSYGSEDRLWEIAVIEFYGPTLDDYNLTYDTPITNDVMGYLTLEDAKQVMIEISELEQTGIKGD